MNYLFVLHDPPYGTERTYNGLRWAREIIKDGDARVRVFLFGDAVVAAAAGQHVPSGYYNVGDMFEALTRKGAEVGLCGTCMDARGLADERIVSGATRSSMSELGKWTGWADRVINI